MNTKTTFGYGIVFDTVGDAFLAQKNLLCIAKAYGSASLAELKSNLGLVGVYEDNKVRWTPSEIDNATIERDSNGKFSIRFPVHDSSDEDDGTIDTDDESHPIYINVTTSDMDDPDCLICSVLTHAQKIQDRDIFINVY